MSAIQPVDSLTSSGEERRQRRARSSSVIAPSLTNGDPVLPPEQLKATIDEVLGEEHSSATLETKLKVLLKDKRTKRIVRSYFERQDQGGKNGCSFEHFETALKQLYLYPDESPEQAQRLFEQFDENRSGCFAFAELLPLIYDRSSQKKEEASLLQKAKRKWKQVQALPEKRKQITAHFKEKRAALEIQLTESKAKSEEESATGSERLMALMSCEQAMSELQQLEAEEQRQLEAIHVALTREEERLMRGVLAMGKLRKDDGSGSRRGTLASSGSRSFLGAESMSSGGVSPSALSHRGSFYSGFGSTAQLERSASNLKNQNMRTSPSFRTRTASRLHLRTSPKLSPSPPAGSLLTPEKEDQPECTSPTRPFLLNSFEETIEFGAPTMTFSFASPRLECTSTVANLTTVTALCALAIARAERDFVICHCATALAIIACAAIPTTASAHHCFRGSNYSAATAGVSEMASIESVEGIETSGSARKGSQLRLSVEDSSNSGMVAGSGLAAARAHLRSKDSGVRPQTCPTPTFTKTRRPVIGLRGKRHVADRAPSGTIRLLERASGAGSRPLPLSIAELACQLLLTELDAAGLENPTLEGPSVDTSRGSSQKRERDKAMTPQCQQQQQQQYWFASAPVSFREFRPSDWA
eukprot:NODE_393_length_2304_cov_32.982705_g364_i0.p1 GENE.NODE_393_length_2304_cov_32.982705_g364_i0~~NODE_393_length_2304_cov_32.982705_g364_i0.p1  ORF type:complete len:643 (+),score=113.23 NODE_393_length_2304_cov_32.982705_g364_i0:144-2072(+)